MSTAGLLAAEPQLRLLGFLGVFALVALAERVAPWRRDQAQGGRRWVANLGVVALDALLVRLLFPAAAMGAAIWAEARGLGALPALAVPPVVAVPTAILLLDLAVYWQHRIFHAVPVLWRLHRMHHADTGFDATTGLRFHPLEILLSMLVKIAVVVALGAPPVAVLLFEVLLNATALFSHGNLRLPARLEPTLRRVLVTPEMHRVHHSARRVETDSNYGFCLSIWDRLFGSHIPRPAAGPDGVTIGLPEFRDLGEQRLDRLLTQPFRTGMAATPAPAEERAKGRAA